MGLFTNVNNNKLYLSTTAGVGAGAVSNVSTWDGSNYAAVGATVTGSTFGRLTSFGTMYTASGAGCDSLKTSNNTWWPLSYSPPTAPSAGFDSIFGGLYNVCNSYHLYQWNGTTNTAVTTNISAGFISNVQADRANNYLFLPGHFTYLSTPNTVLIKYDGSWVSYSMPANTATNVASGASSALEYNGNVYMSGMFNAISGNGYGKLYKWNGTSWDSIWANPVLGTHVVLLTVCNNNLCFTTGDSIYQYDGSNVTMLGKVSNTSTVTAAITSLASYNDTLYVGGNFSTVNNGNSVSVSNLAKFVPASQTTGIKTVNNGAVSVYPNPSNGRFNVNAVNATVNVVDCLGRTVSSTKVNGTQQIEVSAGGAYIIQVTQDGRTYTQRLINQ
jgi:hypothetical protein